MFHPQAQQLINLLFLVLFSSLFKYLYLDWETVLFIVFFTVLIEHIFIYLKYKKITYFSFSSLTTALGVILMVFADSIWIYMVTITLGLAQKHFLTIAGKHFFNPSNFALMMALLFFYRDAHIVLGQLGDGILFGGVVVILSMMILYRVERWMIPVGFVSLYLLFQYIFLVRSDPVLIMEMVCERFYSISFIVFILFMLTDPQTTPKKYRGQLIFALLIALGATLLDYYDGFRVQHLFMALFLISALVQMYEKIDSFSSYRVLTQSTIILFLTLSAIIYIEIQPPYYFEMDH